MTVGPAAEPFNAATWLVDRHVDAGRGGSRALVCLGREQTYAELAGETRRAASLLASVGVGPGERVMLVVADEPGFAAFFLGGLRIGAIPVPTSTMLRPDDIAALAEDASARVLVVSQRYLGDVAVIAAKVPGLAEVVVLDDPAYLGAPAPGGVAPTGPGPSSHSWSAWRGEAGSDPAPTTAATPGFWLYTSGTTGRPKGAVHRHGDLRAVAETYGASVLGIGPEDVCYSVPKLFFAFGLGNALVFPLAVGASAVIDPEPPTPARVADLAVAHRPSLFFAPPGFCAALADAEVPDDILASARATVTAGETLPVQVYRRFRARFGVEMLDGLGSTEALHIFCSNHPGDVRPGCTGRPVSGYELRLTDDAGAEVGEPDTPGSLWVRGESVSQGYWDRPEETAATFVDGWCRTGDVYRRSRDGYYSFVGRNSDMIKAGGIWVSPAEVEAALLGHEGVLEAAAVGARSEDGLEIVVAFVVPLSGATLDPNELARHCRAAMAAFKRPRHIHVVTELPKTATGKIRRYALREGLRAAAPA